MGLVPVKNHILVQNVLYKHALIIVLIHQLRPMVNAFKISPQVNVGAMNGSIEEEMIVATNFVLMIVLHMVLVLMVSVNATLTIMVMIVAFLLFQS